MTNLTYPTMNVINFAINEVYVCADTASVNQYCTEKGYTLDSYVAETKQRFSNDGALPYQYYTGSEWKLEFGFKKVVAQLTYH